VNRYRDWLEQALRDYEKAEIDFRHGYYEWACFTCQQAAEKALKALCLFHGMKVRECSLVGITKVLIEGGFSVPEEVISAARRLDKFYIPTRYPNGFTFGKPADYYDKKDAEEALDAAGFILQWCKSQIGRD